MEMLVVVVLISLLLGIAIPSFQAGLPSIRLRSASSSVAQFLSAARSQVEREQRPVVLHVVPGQGVLAFQTIDVQGQRAPVAQEVKVPDGIVIRGVFPAFPGRESAARQFVLFPGASLPPFAIALANERGAARWVSLDPITYVPLISDVAPVQTMENAAAPEGGAP